MAKHPPHAPAAPPQPPADRYAGAKANQAPITGKVLAVVLGVLAIALVVTVVGFLYQQFTGEKISGEAIATEVVDDSSLSLTVDVTSNRPDRDGFCIVRAKEYSGAEVGRAEIYVPAGKETTRVTITFPTTARAYVGDVYGCSFDIPDYLDRTSQ